MSTFKPGDRVMLTEAHKSLPIGAQGKITMLLGDEFRVNFSTYFFAVAIPADKLALVEPEKAAEGPTVHYDYPVRDDLRERPATPPPDHAADLAAIRELVRKELADHGIPPRYRNVLDRIFDLTLPAEYRSREGG